jgi:IclR family pca regulon transcriptional regulator
MSVMLMPGSRLPAYCTSMGRVLLAALPDAEALETLNASQRIARTPRTETDLTRIMEELARIREQGYAGIDQEVENGLRSMAVPLTNFHGKVVAALNVGLALTDEPMADVIARYLPALKATQAEISRTLR